MGFEEVTGLRSAEYRRTAMETECRDVLPRCK